MPDVAESQNRDLMQAGSGKLLAADGSVYDYTAAIQAIVRGMGGDTGDIESIRQILLASLRQLELIEGNTDALENTIGAIDLPHGTGVSVMGGKAETAVPTAVADADAVALWMDEYGRLIQVATDLAQSALSVSDVAPAQMQVARWLDWAALTAPAQETPEANVQDYENFSVEYVIATIDTSVDLIVWGSVDGGTTWFPLWSGTVLAADPQTDVVTFEDMAVERIKCEFDGEAGGTAATVTFKVMTGN